MNFYLLFPFIPKKYKYACPYNLRKQGLLIANFTCIIVSASAYKKNQGKIIWRTGQLELGPANYKVNVYFYPNNANKNDQWILLGL